MSQTTPAQRTLTNLLLLLLFTGSTLLPAIGQTAGPQSLANRQSAVYVCSMHPEVRSEEPGTCAKCGVPLVAMSSPPEIMNYELRLETTPATLAPAEQLKLRFSIFQPKIGEQVKQFDIVYDKPFHLFIVSQDLEYYDHSHPTLESDGSFSIETSLPKAGSYKVFCEFLPRGGTPQIIQKSLTTADFHSGGHHVVETSLVADKSLRKSLDGIRFELKLAPAVPVAGQPTLLRYYLTDDKTGLPVKNLQPYLGAWGHTATISEDGTEFLHSHPTRLISAGVDRATLVSRPGITFHTYFPRPGHYRIWSQFQRDNKVITVSFTISVSQLDRMAKWNGRSWATLGRLPINSINAPVRALAVNGNELYVGGDFTMVDGVNASRIVRWDGHTWSALGSGVNGSVWSIALDGKDVYVGGDFTMAGGVSANRIAKWDGSNWSALADGVTNCKDAFCSPAVYALAVDKGLVYAGGRFASAGGIRTSGIAKWDGQGWSALGDGVRTGVYDGIVKALAVRGKDVFVGGQFLTAGRVRTYNVAKWTGESWLSLNGGVRGNLEEVLALGVSGNSLYVGGTFNTAGGVDAPNIAKWDGAAWSPVAVLSQERVRSIVVSGNHIYVGGGLFTLPNGNATEGVVQWNGQSWSGLGSHFVTSAYAGPIMTIAMSGNDLYIGGDSLIMQKEKASHPMHH